MEIHRGLAPSVTSGRQRTLSGLLHLTLDELIRSVQGVRNALVNLENCADEERAEFERVGTREMSLLKK
jgi:hypothetical protein